MAIRNFKVSLTSPHCLISFSLIRSANFIDKNVILSVSHFERLNLLSIGIPLKVFYTAFVLLFVEKLSYFRAIGILPNSKHTPNITLAKLDNGVRLQCSIEVTFFKISQVNITLG